MDLDDKVCPYCQSTNILPFEEEDPQRNQESLMIIIIAAMTLMLGYFFLVVSAYLFFPFVIFAALIFTSFIINRKERRANRKQDKVAKDFICIDCSNTFKISI